MQLTSNINVGDGFAAQLAYEGINQSEEDLRRITDLIPQAIIVLDPDGKATYANRVALEYTGLSLDEIRAANFRSRVFHHDDIQRLLDERSEALRGTAPFENEQRARNKAGEYRWFLIQYSPFLDENGAVVHWYATGTDIHDRKRVEEELFREQRELRRKKEIIDLAQKAANAMAFDWYIQQETNSWSPEQEALYGLTPGTFDGKYESWKNLIHPDDWPEVVKAVKSAHETGAIAAEFRVVWPDGSVHWLAANGRMFMDTAGRPYRMVGFTADVTPRKLAEESLRQAFNEIKKLKDQLHNENVVLREEIVRSSMFEEIVGSSAPLREVLEQVSKVAPTDSTVLIQGETGTGKELIARAIHKRSRRSKQPFIRVNCGAITASLVASELFGHEKGAFTGATQRRLGRFEAADKGTIFLDEVGELTADTQIALLRVLQEREFERVGSNHVVAVDVRVIAATNGDLDAAVARGEFRRDLFYRLNVFPIRTPPLRERVDDIPLLLEYLIGRYAKLAGKNFNNIDKRTLKLFQEYDWPGNVRELQNIIERAVILSDGTTFSVDQTWFSRDDRTTSPTDPLPMALEEREREAIEGALLATHGRIGGPAGAAAKLGIPRQTLESKIKTLGIDKFRFKTS